MLYYLFLLGIEGSSDKCPITAPSETCHVGLRHMCSHDVDCINGTFCCFTGCRRQCWDPVTRGGGTFSKRTNILPLPKLNILLWCRKTNHYRGSQSLNSSTLFYVERFSLLRADKKWPNGGDVEQGCVLTHVSSMKYTHCSILGWLCTAICH